TGRAEGASRGTAGRFYGNREGCRFPGRHRQAQLRSRADGGGRAAGLHRQGLSPGLDRAGQGDRAPQLITANYSPRAPAALITGPHLATSAVRCAIRAAGVASSMATGSAPSVARRSITLGSLRAACRAVFSFAATSVGRPLGAHMACQAVTSKTLRPDSARVGRSGRQASRVRVVAAYPLILPSLMRFVVGVV